MTTGRIATDDPLSARRVLSELERQRSVALAKQAQLAAERRKIAFAANTGDASAQRGLAALNKEALGTSLEVENLDAALSEARDRIAQADAAAHHAELRRKAALAREKLADLDEIGRALTAALGQLAASFARFEAVGDEIRRLGIGGFPSRDLLRVNASRAIDAALWHLKLSNRPVAPSQRVTLDALVAAWAAAVEARVAQVLDDDPDHEEAA